MRAWIQAARPLAHANIAPPILLGAAFALALGVRLDPLWLAFALAFGVLDHLVIVFANDYADREADTHHDAPTFFSGGSRVIQEGKLTPPALQRAAWLSAGLLFALGLAGAALDRPLMPVLALAALALLSAYSLPPLRLVDHGFGEILQGLGVGAVLPMVGFYALAGSLERFPFDALAPLVLLGFVSNMLTALPDVHADRAAGKLSWPVRRGEARARRDALVLLGLGVVLVTQVGPALPMMWIGAALAPAALATLLALRFIRGADAEHRDACVRFVTLAAGAIAITHLGWAGALYVSSAG